MHGADVGCVDDLPDDGDDDRRQHHGDQEHRAQRLQEPRAHVEQQGEAKADQELQQDGPEGELDLHPDRVVEARVGPELMVALEGLREVPQRLGSREVERREAGGQQVERRQQRDDGQHRQ
jgi:hypothetical protein